jgi:hypothetical protein
MKDSKKIFTRAFEQAIALIGRGEALVGIADES